MPGVLGSENCEGHRRDPEVGLYPHQARVHGALLCLLYLDASPRWTAAAAVHSALIY